MTAQWDGGELLQPIATDQPCGEDVEYTLLPAFDTYRLFGQTARPDTAPDWGEIRTKAIEGLRKSKDLRLLAHLGTALLRTEGLSEFARTLTIASEWVAAYWPQLYPLVDEDAMLRRNAMNCFADPVAVIEAIRRAPLVSNRQHGTFTLRDIEIASGQLQPADGETRHDESVINAAFAAMPLEHLAALQETVAGALAALKRIDATMAAKGGPEAVPAFDSLSAQLAKVDRVLRAHLASRAPVTDDAESAGVTAPGGDVGAVGNVRSRQDAIRALDAVAEFFRRNEPSSPVPLLIDRAKRLVSKNFLEVLADVAPDGLAQARSVSGVPNE